MTMALRSSGRPDRVGPVQKQPEDRWSVPRRMGRFSLGMALVIFASVALHVVIVGTAVMGGPAVSAPPQDIAVEIVHEVPQPKPEARTKAPELKPALAPKASTKMDAKSDPPKIEDAKPPSPPEELAKTEPAKSEATKTEPAKLEATKSEPDESEPAKDSPAKPDEAKRDTVKAAAPTPAADEQRTLESELAALKAEQAALQAERAAEAEGATPAQTRAPGAQANTGFGPLPDSFQAVALPATADDADEAVSYQQIVFSQLAKAKEIGQRQGLPGSAGVHFSIDERGKLLEVEIVHRSGVASLDAEAVAIVRKAAPFPPPPQGAQLSFDADVNFVVERAR